MTVPSASFGGVPPSTVSWSLVLRDTIPGFTLPPVVGATIHCECQMNTAGLSGHPTDGHSWTTAIGVKFTLLDGSTSFVVAQSMAAGTSGALAGDVAIPVNVRKIEPWFQIEADQTTLTSFGGNSLAWDARWSMSYGGYQIIPMPTSPVFRQIAFRMMDSVAETTSPFTKKSQFQQWLGADGWEVDVSMPPMTKAQANAWIAWQAALRGKGSAFLLGDPLYASLGAVAGMPAPTGKVNGAVASGSNIVPTKAWSSIPGGLVGLMSPGDYVQLGGRLHKVVNRDRIDAFFDNSANLEVWPVVREALVDNQAVVVQSPVGLFRLSDNSREWNISEMKMYGLNFKAVEAR
jgi:hypothetical protein